MVHFSNAIAISLAVLVRSFTISSLSARTTFPTNPTFCPNNGVTSCCKGDGFGAQYATLMGVYTYARAYNITYCSTPWSRLAHNLGNESFWYQFVGGDMYGPPARPRTKRIQAMPDPWRGIDPQVRADIQTSVQEDIRHMYFASEKPPLIHYPSYASSGAVYNIAWHIRRGDVSSEDGRRFTTNQDIIRGLRYMRHQCGKDCKLVHFFSQGNLADFKDIVEACNHLKIECAWHLDEDLAVTFHHMVKADVLIMANSALSGVAGLLSDGIVVPDHQLASGSFARFSSLPVHDIFAHLEQIERTNDFNLAVKEGREEDFLEKERRHESLS